MQLEQSFTLPQPPDAAWPMFKNIDLLVECLPGASLTGPAVDGEVPLRFDVKLGPIAAGFIGAGRVSFDDAAQAGRFEGQAADKRTSSRVKGAAAFALQADAAGTRVQVTVDYALTGALAQFSRGAIVRELASALTSQFAANLAARLETVAPVTAATAHALAASGDPMEQAIATAIAPLAPTVVPLSAWSLLRHVLVARWDRLWHRPS
jgi:carbon monoxide dehydrogenase subunit G